MRSFLLKNGNEVSWRKEALVVPRSLPEFSFLTSSKNYAIFIAWKKLILPWNRIGTKTISAILQSMV
jgi:hypothetical protein